MDEFKNSLISALLFGLIIFGILTIFFSYVNENNQDTTILNDYRLNKTYYNINNSLSKYQDTAEEQRNLTNSDNPLLGTDSFLFNSMIGVFRVFQNILIDIPNIAISFIFDVISFNYIVTGVIGTIIIIIIIFGGWKLWKQGG